MSESFLQKFQSSLPSTQGNQILKLLISKKDSGEIRTLEEFKDKLKELTSKLLQERIIPTLERFEASIKEDISSEQYNEMLARIEDDLTAAFIEADTLDAVISAHNQIINNVSLEALRIGVNELEAKTALYEFLNTTNKGFDDAVFNTFRQSQKLETSRSDGSATVVYIDPRLQELIPVEQNAFADPLGEFLVLGSENKIYWQIKNSEWLSNENSIRSELDVTFKNSNIRNIIDGQTNTFWIVPILLSEVKSSGVPLEVDLDLGTTKNINFVEIEPASDFPFELIGIDYLDANNIRRTLTSNTLNVKEPSKIIFQRVAASHLILRIKQYNYKEIQFTQKPGESNFHKALLRESSNSIDLSSVSTDLKEILSSDFVISSVFGIQNQSLSQKKFFQYLIGFDNIRIGADTFQERSIFVSRSKTIENLGQVGLRVLEKRPVQTAGSSSISLEPFSYPSFSTTEDSKYYHSSVEYWCICKLFSQDNYLIDTVITPLLPLGASRIYHERLILTRKSSTLARNNDQGSFIFYVDPNPNDVKVYKNGTLLVYGNNDLADWEFVPALAGEQDTLGNTLSSSVNADISQNIPGVLNKPMKRGIRLWETVRPLDIYTISYTPKISNTYSLFSETNTLVDVIDMTGQQFIRLVRGNVNIFDSLRKSQLVAKTDIYLTVIMRRNSAIDGFSPVLEEYLLATGSKDELKFLNN